MTTGGDPAAALAGFETSFAGTPQAVRGALSLVRGVLPPVGAQRDLVELVLAEVLNNVVEHACADRPDHVIMLKLQEMAGAITFEVRDDGRPMPGLTLPGGQRPDIDVPRQNLPEGGFGWFLVRTLAAEIDYERRGDINILRFVVDLAATGRSMR